MCFPPMRLSAALGVGLPSLQLHHLYLPLMFSDHIKVGSHGLHLAPFMVDFALCSLLDGGQFEVSPRC